MSARRRPQPARQPWEKRARATVAYLELYVEHTPFLEALQDLYEHYCRGSEELLALLGDLFAVRGLTLHTGPTATWADAYLAALRATARRFGLHRLGAPAGRSSNRFAPSRGETFLHDWCHTRAFMAQSLGRDWPAENLPNSITHGGPRPSVGEIVREVVPVTGPEGERALIVDDRQPLIHVHIDDRWDPRLEPMAKAQARLLAEAARQIRSELERLAVDAETRGYEFVDTSPKTREHLRWLFEHIALGMSYGQIAQEHLGGWYSAPTVYNQIKPYAELLDIRLGRD
jgi:hypothetical protein